jgi:fluoride exporter
MRYLCVLGGGAVGSLLRYLAGVAIMSRWTGRFPIATFLINVTGSFAIGILATVLANAANPLWRPLLITGVLGGYTTFSSFEYETFAAARGGAAGIAWLYLIGSVILGYLACWLGAALVGFWSGRAG